VRLGDHLTRGDEYRRRDAEALGQGGGRLEPWPIGVVDGQAGKAPMRRAQGVADGGKAKAQEPEVADDGDGLALGAGVACGLVAVWNTQDQDMTGFGHDNGVPSLARGVRKGRMEFGGGFWLIPS